MTTDSRPNPTDKPRRPALDHHEAMRLAATEYERVIAQLRGLSAEDWTKPTECVGWDVRAMACHMLGMAEMVTSRREQKRQVGIAEAAQKNGAVFIDALTDLQVTERKDLTSAQIIERFVAAAPRAAKFRRRLPAPRAGSSPFLPNRSDPARTARRSAGRWAI